VKPRLAFLLAIAPLLMAETTAPLPADQETEHVVKAGETLSGIAQRAKVPRVLIVEANRLTEPYALRSGQKLSIPRTRRHTVAEGDTSFTIAYLYGVAWRDIAVANGIEPGAALKNGQNLLIPTIIAKPAEPDAPAAAASTEPSRPRFTWPAAGNVRRSFAARGRTSDYHDGIDLVALEGTAVRASAAGKVLFAGEEPRQFGKLVVVDHGHGWQSSYAFLSRITVKQGDEVRQGERVGLSGHTGRARGSELHFELRRDNRPVDPAGQLPARTRN
jgi:murein DD-endopeptidase MepM/ murein hydrolase activator NlpD